MEIGSVQDFRSLVEQVRQRELYRQITEGNIHKAVFRGQENEKWDLIPKLLRYGHSIEEIKDIQRKILEDFRKELVAKGYDKHFQDGFLGKDNFHSDWLLIQQAQHVGLATRFMDWSVNPEIACFFACLGSPNDDGAFYILYPEAEWFQADRPKDTYADIDPLLFEDIVLLNPAGFMDDQYDLKFLERFKSRQNGRFLVQSINDVSVRCLSRQPFFDRALEKHIIKKEVKADLIAEIGLSTDFVYMESDPLVQEIRPAIDRIVTELHQKYSLYYP